MTNNHFQYKIILCFSLIIFTSCKHEKVYQATLFDTKVDLNEHPNVEEPVFSQRHLKSRKEKWVGGIFGSKQFKEWNEVLYNNTVIRINPQVAPPSDSESSDYPSQERSQYDFDDVTYINPSKTSFIARISGPYSIGNRFYLFTAQKSGLKVYSIDRPTVIEGDRQWENRDMVKFGPDILMVDNDYVFNQKTGKAYEITRPGKDRIRGEFAALSPDKQTIAFTTNQLLYQCHYPSGKVHIERIDDQQLSKMVTNKSKEWPYNYFTWITVNGKMFLSAASSSK
ncbi:hypothetical protein [Pedobacter antarcticus]|nr:hypothetical protein [Pedobacter antarcticus]